MSETSPVKQEKENLGRSGAIVSVMTMLSRILGMVRDTVIAIVMGASAMADAFFIAFRLPQFLRRLFAEGAFAQAFVPVLSEYRATRSEEEVRQLVDHVAGCLGAVLLIVTGLAVLGAPWLTYLFAPGFHNDPAKFALTAELLRITFPYLLLISLTGLVGSVLNAYGRFAVPAFVPVLLNMSLIVAALVFGRNMVEPAYALAWGVLAAGVLQFSFQLPFVARLGLLPRPRMNWRDPGVKRILLLMVPAMFGVSVSQINLTLDTILASFLPTGSVSWLYYSDRLSELPLGVIGIAVATVILPALSRQYARQEGGEFARTLDWGIRTVITVSVPAALALLVLAEPILVTLFQYGKLTDFDVQMSSLSLRAYALGLLAFMLVKVLATGFYAQMDLKTPVRIGIIAMVANMGFNLILVIPLHMYWKVGHVGLALATTCSAWLNAWLLWRGLNRREVWHWSPTASRELGRVLLAAVAMAGLLWGADQLSPVWSSLPWWERGVRLVAICLAGMGCYFAVLWLMGARPAQLKAPSA